MRRRPGRSIHDRRAELQQAEVMLASGSSVADTCISLQINKQTLYRWRKQLHAKNDGKRIEELVDENSRLRRIVADQALLIQELQDRCRKD